MNVNPLMDERLFIPNVITPNGDGENDLLTLKPNLKELSLEIFNRWGEPFTKPLIIKTTGMRRILQPAFITCT